MQSKGKNEEGNRFATFRHRYPYEQADEEGVEGNVGLDFNFWQANRYLTIELVNDIVESCVFPSSEDRNKIPTLKSLPGIQNTVCLFLEDFDPTYFTEFSDSLPFLRDCSSIPFISAKIDTIRRELAAANANPSANNTSNTNAWFWNDVKHTPSLLFWPRYGLNFSSNSSLNSSIIEFSARNFFLDHQITWQCEHSNAYDAIVFTPEKIDVDSLAIILDGAKTAFRMNNLHDQLVYSHFFTSPSTEGEIIFGSILHPRNNAPGFYLAKIPACTRQKPSKSANFTEIVVVLIWQTGVIDILYEQKEKENEEASSNHSEYSIDQFITLKNFKNNSSEEEEAIEEAMTLTLLSLRPFRYLDPHFLNPSVNLAEAVPSSDAPQSSEEKKQCDPKLEESSQTIDTTMLQLREKYTSYGFVKEDYLPFLLSTEVLEFMGYLVDSTYVLFLDSKDAQQWKYQSGFLPTTARNPSHLYQNHHHRFSGLEDEMEDGEEIEECTPNLSVAYEPVLPPLLQKLKEQAIHCFPFEPHPTEEGELSAKTMAIFPLDVLAVDCEMCSTRDGLELARVSLIHPIHGIILDTFVKPALEILDYHTEFSGVTEASLEKITISLKDIQHFLPLVMNAETILIGHSLDNDLKALRIIHTTIIDTSALYPHGLGIPHKIALKTLAKDYLHWMIQDGNDGHDSIQDSIAALELCWLQMKFWKEECRGGKAQPGPVRNERLLPKEVVSSEAIAITEGTDTSTNLSSSASKTSWKFTFLDYLLYRLPYRCPSSSKTSAIKTEQEKQWLVHGFGQLMFGDRPSWERMTFGYRKEGDLSYIFDTFQSQYPQVLHSTTTASSSSSTAGHPLKEIDCSFHECVTWQEVLLSLQQHLQRSSSGSSDNHHPHLYFGTLNFQKELDRDLTFLRAFQTAKKEKPVEEIKEGKKRARDEEERENDEQQPSKKQKLEASSSPLTLPEAKTIFERINEALEQFTAALPPHTMLLIFTQRNLKEMRRLISRKIRYKWDNAPYNPPVPTTSTTNTAATTTPTTTSATSAANPNPSSSTTTSAASSAPTNAENTQPQSTKRRILKKPKVPIILKPGVSSSSGMGAGSGGTKRSYQSNNNSGGNGSGLGGSFVMGYDWEPSTDENRLIEETNRVATCALFLKYKE